VNFYIIRFFPGCVIGPLAVCVCVSTIRYDTICYLECPLIIVKPNDIRYVNYSARWFILIYCIKFTRQGLMLEEKMFIFFRLNMHMYVNLVNQFRRSGSRAAVNWSVRPRVKAFYYQNVLPLYIVNIKKLQFIHSVNGDGSSTAKII